MDNPDRVLVAVDDFLRDGVLDLLLDGAAEVTRAVLDGVGLLRQVIQHRVVPAQGDAPVGQTGFQLVQHNDRDVPEVGLGELVEADDLVHPVDELGPQELAQGLERLVPSLLGQALAEAHGALLPVGAGVGGHDDDGVLEVHQPALGVGDAAVVQNLEQDIHHVGMGLLDLVEENDGVGLAADLLRQLAGLVVAHVARRAAHDAGNGVLLHKLGHIQADEALGGIEQIVGQLLHQLRLAHAGGAHEDEADGLVLGADAHPVAADGGGHGGNGLVLAYDVLFQPVLQLRQALEFLLLDLAARW